ncbi:MAG: DinB family protein [Vicinamibacterales bacterium]
MAESDVPPNTPYTADLGDREPLEALGDTPGRIRDLVGSWSTEQFERSYAPGKWSARQVLIHLAQTELALGARARFALSQQGYTAQPFSQDDWIGIDGPADALTALDVYTTLRSLNVVMFAALTPEQRMRSFAHPEYGTVTIWWIAAQMAGHDIHHLKQLESI